MQYHNAEPSEGDEGNTIKHNILSSKYQ